jgi:para-aminobenzoate synthetase
MRLYASVLNGWVHPADAYLQLHSGHENAFWIDRENHPDSRFSVIGSSAATDWVSADEIANLVKAKLQDFGDLQAADEAARNLPFDWRPGLVGVHTYEGDGAFLQIDRALVFDHDQRRLYFLGAFDSEIGFEQWHHAALLRFALVGGESARFKQRAAAQEAKSANAPTVSSLRHNPRSYLRLIERAQAAIASGEVYQLCLTNRLFAESTVDPLYAFLKLRESNPAPYSTYLSLSSRTGENFALVCSSPERFIEVQQNRRLVTKPIKGTRPRIRDANGNIIEAEDAAIAAELAQNQKERAENLMIVDLMRNDFLKVCAEDTVTVSKLFAVESYATVHQLVSTVEGILLDDFAAVDAVLACFPGGSMTGAPKSRAMELIEELEDCERGVYSGVVGWYSASGQADFAMIIRSAVFEANRVTVGIGGGITIDSEPDAELEETRLKAKALLNALNLADPWV